METQQKMFNEYLGKFINAMGHKNWWVFRLFLIGVTIIPLMSEPFMVPNTRAAASVAEPTSETETKDRLKDKKEKDDVTAGIKISGRAKSFVLDTDQQTANNSSFTPLNWWILPPSNPKPIAKVFIEPTDWIHRKAITEAINRWNATGVVDIQSVGYQAPDVTNISTNNYGKQSWAGLTINGDNDFKLIDGVDWNNNIPPHYYCNGGNIQINTHFLDTYYSGNEQNEYHDTIHVAEHELGHLIGLAHNDYRLSVMQCGGGNNMYTSTIGLVDVNAIAKQYNEPLLNQGELNARLSGFSDRLYPKKAMASKRRYKRLVSFSSVRFRHRIMKWHTRGWCKKHHRAYYAPRVIWAHNRAVRKWHMGKRARRHIRFV